jgi:hypothetical protein
MSLIQGSTISRQMKSGKIQETILRWISKTIRATDDVRRYVFDDLGQSVPDEEITAALLGLHATGYLTSYIYDSQTGEYALVNSPAEYSIDVLYWLARQVT